MEIEAIRVAVATWASKTPEIRRAWLYGSRARGEHRPDSDVDIAVEVIPHGEESPDGIATYIFEVESWRKQLQPELRPFILDLDLVGADDDIVAPAVRRYGILLYER